MQIFTEEFMDFKLAIGIVYDHRDDLTDRELRVLSDALDSIEHAEERLAKANEKQARYMKQRRRNLQGRM